MGQVSAAMATTVVALLAFGAAGHVPEECRRELVDFVVHKMDADDSPEDVQALNRALDSAKRLLNCSDATTDIPVESGGEQPTSRDTKPGTLERAAVCLRQTSSMEELRACNRADRAP